MNWDKMCLICIFMQMTIIYCTGSTPTPVFELLQKGFAAIQYSLLHLKLVLKTNTTKLVNFSQRKLNQMWKF